jgi:peptidyl-prolyl cis-trans isomerase C
MLSLITLMLIGCEPPPPPVPGVIDRTGEVLKVVNGQNVTQGMVDAQVDQLPDNVKESMLARGGMEKLTENIIIGEILYQEALKQKLDQDPKVKVAIAFAERNALVTQLLERTVKARTTDEAVKKWYDEHAVQFAKPQAKARHILVADEAEAKAIYAEVSAARATFADVAMKKSTDKGSAKEGGDLGWFEKQRMVPEFAEAVFAGKKGDLIGPVKTKFGFHIIEIEEMRDSVPVEDVSDKIKEKLREEVIQTYIEEVKKASTITDPVAAGGATVTPAAADAATTTGAAPAAPAGEPAKTDAHGHEHK